MTERSRPADWLLLFASLACVALVAGAPVARANHAAAASLLYAFFGLVCHQIPERSFHLLGEPLAVCHRCLGLYLGFPIGLLLLTRFSRLRARLLGSPRWIGLFFVPMAIDVVLHDNTWASRFATGLLAALPIGLLLSLAITELLSRHSSAAAESFTGPPASPPTDVASRRPLVS